MFAEFNPMDAETFYKVHMQFLKCKSSYLIGVSPRIVPYVSIYNTPAFVYMNHFLDQRWPISLMHVCDTRSDL